MTRSWSCMRTQRYETGPKKASWRLLGPNIMVVCGLLLEGEDHELPTGMEGVAAAESAAPDFELAMRRARCACTTQQANSLFLSYTLCGCSGRVARATARSSGMQEASTARPEDEAAVRLLGTIRAARHLPAARAGRHRLHAHAAGMPGRSHHLHSHLCVAYGE